MDEIRVLLINLRGVLGDVIEAVLMDCADVRVIGHCSDRDARATIAGSNAEVVVCQVDDATAADIAGWLFQRHDRVKVVAIREDGRQAALWELHPKQGVVGDLSPRLLADTVRGVGDR